MAYNDGTASVSASIGSTYIIKNDGFAIAKRAIRDPIGVVVPPIGPGNFNKNYVRNYQCESIVISSYGDKYVKPFIFSPDHTPQNPTSVKASDAGQVELIQFSSKMAIAYGGPNTEFKSSFTGKPSNAFVMNYHRISFPTSSLFPYRISQAVEKDDSILITEPAVVMVESVNKLGFGLTTSIQPATVIVEDYKPPTFNFNGSGSGLKTISLVLQINAFVEMYMVFEEGKVVEAIGLPYGLMFEKGYMKGTPMLAGTYPVKFMLDNGRSLDGLITIPQLPRKL